MSTVNSCYYVGFYLIIVIVNHLHLKSSSEQVISCKHKHSVRLSLVKKINELRKLQTTMSDFCHLKCWKSRRSRASFRNNTFLARVSGFDYCSSFSEASHEFDKGFLKKEAFSLYIGQTKSQQANENRSLEDVRADGEKFSTSNLLIGGFHCSVAKFDLQAFSQKWNDEITTSVSILFEVMLEATS